MPRLTILLAFLLAFAAPARVAAQSATEQFRDRYGHDCCRDFAEFKYMCEMIQRGRVQPGPTCEGAGSGSGSSSSRPPVPRGAFAEAAILGFPLGVLLGSLKQNPDSASFWLGGGAIGFATVGAIALAAKARDMSTPAVLVVAPLVGAAGGAGYGLYQKAQIDPTLPVAASDPDPNQAIVRDAGIGAAAAFVTYGIGKLAITVAEHRTIPPIFRALGHLQLIPSAHRLRCVFAW